MNNISEDEGKYIRKTLYPEYRKEPLKENVIAFESFWGRKYSCNPAAFYEYIDRNHPEYECVWFLNDTDTEINGRAVKVQRGTKEHYHYLATAKFFISNANMPRSFVKRNGQVVVHTMHGTPYKTFGLDVKEETETETKAVRLIERSLLWDYLVAQGEFTKSMAWRWFRYDKTVLETGYPRTDRLFENDEAKKTEIRKAMGLPGDKKIILYAPTWRSMDSFEMKADLDSMKEKLSGDYALIIRLHHFEADHYEVPCDGSFIFDGGTVDKIEDLFAVSDIMVTDYSSVMFDYALTGKPMIFFTYDLEEYTGKDRGAYFDICEEAPGPIAKTTDELIDCIINIESRSEEIAGRKESFLEKYLTYENPDSCERLFEEVFVKQTHLANETAGDRADQLMKRVLPGRAYRRIRRKKMVKLLKSERR